MSRGTSPTHPRQNRTHEDDDWPTDRYDRYVPWDSEYSMSRCPWCGGLLKPYQNVRTVGGQEGIDLDFTMPDRGGHPNVRTYHPRCWRKRELVKRRVENQRLDAFL